MRTLITFCLVAISSTTFAADEGEVRRVISAMSNACTEQMVDVCMEYYTEDTDFENSFGWTVTGRKALRSFMGDYLFKRYPKSTAKQEDELSVELLSPVIAQVELARSITPEGGDPRIYRFSYLLKLEDGNWRIWKTRIWQPRAVEAPENFVEPNRFPSIQN